MELYEQEVESIRTLPAVEETTEKQTYLDQMMMMVMTTILFTLIMTLILKLEAIIKL
jgi:hypothetical protein